MKIAIIGGGASGIATALFAKRSAPHLNITVFERGERILKKLLATGNGRCNLSNSKISEENYFSHNPEYLKKILSSFTYDDEKRFFAEIGIEFCEDNSRIYPYSRRANAVCDALRFACTHLGITVRTNTFINKITKEKNGFKINGIFFDRVVISAGGFSAPSFGTDGNSFNLLKSLGHHISPLCFALSPVKVAQNVKSLKGVRAYGDISLFCGDTLLKKESGEIQFTDYGLSGICVMQLSRLCKKDFTLKVDLIKEKSLDDFYETLLKRKSALSHLTAADFLCGFFHKALSLFILSECSLSSARSVSSLSEKELFEIAKAAKELSFTVLSVLGKEHSQATSGGAYLDEFDCETLESKITKGLYCVGEALDCVGDCGGYNLHWAWTTASLVGKAVAIC